MDNWKEYKLKDVAFLTTGFPFDGHKYGKDGVRVVRGDNVTIGSLRWDAEKDKRWSEPFERASEYSLKADDIVIGMDGSRVGKNRAQVKVSDLPLLLAQRVACVRHNELSIQSFLYYQIFNDKFEKYIRAVQTGTSIPHVSLKQIGDYPIMLPPLAVQHKISDILKSLDDKIECNRRINENLEQQAQALFKSWFVDFEPFKDQPFVESELGMIPQSLQIEFVSDIPHVLETGRRPKGGVGEITHGIPSVGAEHVKGMGNYDYSKTKYISEEYAATLKTGKIKGYELLIYKDGGMPGYFIPNYSIFGEGYPFEECYLNEHVFKLDFNDRGYNAFCYFYFRTDYVMNYLNAQGGKAAIPGINRQDIENIKIYSPKNEIVKKFGEHVLPMFKKMLVNCKESRRLAELRDTLLPKLMSGEINVNDVQMAISE